MAIASGVGPHRAWLSVGGQMLPILSGSATQTKTKKSSSFSAELPLTSANEALFANLGQNDSSVIVLSSGSQKPLVSGEIDSVHFRYIAGFISVSGRCKSAKLHEKKTAEKWINKNHHEVVKDLASRAGLSTDIDSSLALKAGRMMQIDWTRLTDNISFATAIHKAAEILGARWWVDAQGTLHFKGADSPQGTYTINYQNGSPASGDVLSLEISRNCQAGKSIKVNVKSFHPGKKKSFTGTYTVGGVGDTVEYNYHLAGHDQEHCDRHAKNKAGEIARHELSLSAEMVGDPTIDVAMKLQLQGTAFAQSFEMDSISHSFGMRGYRMHISAKSAKQGRS